MLAWDIFVPVWKRIATNDIIICIESLSCSSILCQLQAGYVHLPANMDNRGGTMRKKERKAATSKRSGMYEIIGLLIASLGLFLD